VCVSVGFGQQHFFLSFGSLTKLCVIPRKIFESIIKLFYPAAKKMLFENSVEFFYLQLNKLAFLTAFRLQLPQLHRARVSHCAVLVCRELEGRKFNCRW
jgi:hypothetical protein